jgi:hypothetical protein
MCFYPVFVFESLVYCLNPKLEKSEAPLLYLKAKTGFLRFKETEPFKLT